MRPKSLLAALAVPLLTVVAVPSASAAWTAQVPTCGGCGPTQTAEFFIYNDSGAGAFGSTPITGLPVGWSSTRVNANYAVATGPTAFLSSWFEDYLGNQADSLEIDMFFWSGAPLASTISFAANYTWSNGLFSLNCQNFGAGCSGQLDATGVNYDRSPTSVPEPATAALVGLTLLGWARSRRRSA